MIAVWVALLMIACVVGFLSTFDWFSNVNWTGILMSWEERPKWIVEYFGKGVTHRTLSKEEIAKKWGVQQDDSHFLNSMEGTEFVRIETWRFVQWSGHTFSSEKAALKAFRKSSVFKDAPHVKFQAKCAFQGVPKSAARLAKMEAAKKAQIEYNDQYTTFLEAELEKMKELA